MPKLDCGYLVSDCQLLKDFVQDYLAAKDDKEHERELLAEVIVITKNIIVSITIMVILVKVIWALDEEYQWWEGRMEEVEVAGTKHKLAR